MIEIKSVTKKYGDFTAIDNISITVDDCSVLGIAGYNGAGKTTLLKVCSGVFKADRGEVLLDGKDVYDNEVEKQKLFYLPDEMWFSPSATLKSAAKYYAGYYPDFDFGVFNKICKLFSLDTGNKVRSLSKGMTRQLLLAIAFASRPKYLLIDETFDGLDPYKKTLLKKIFLEYIAETNASVIITSHDLDEISEVCDHVVLINGKTVQVDCQTEDVSEHFRHVTMTFPAPVNESKFSSVNYKKLKLSGRAVSMLIFGNIHDELQKLRGLGADSIESEMLTLSEVFMAEMEEEHDEETVENIFAKENKSG